MSTTKALIVTRCEQDGCKSRATVEYHYREIVTETDEWHRYCDDPAHMPLARHNWIIESRLLALLPDLKSAPPEDAVEAAAARLRQLLTMGLDLNALRTDFAHVVDYLEDSKSWIGD